MRSLVFAADLAPGFSEGSRLLWLAMRRRGLSQSALRAQLGCAGGVIGRWLLGSRKPSASFRVLLVDLLGVPVNSWDMPPRKPFSPKEAA